MELDAAGNYNVLLGSTKNGGMPAELFGANEPRWLQVSFHVPDAVDSPRVLLVSVPYALKAWMPTRWEANRGGNNGAGRRRAGQEVRAAGRGQRHGGLHPVFR